MPRPFKRDGKLHAKYFYQEKNNVDYFEISLLFLSFYVKNRIIKEKKRKNAITFT